MNMAAMTYDGTQTDVQIEGQRNPWVEVDGTPVNWTASNLPRVPCPCGENGPVVLAGVLDSMDTDEGVQRCDTCLTYPGDLDAALALARLVGGVAKFAAAN